MKKYLYLLVAIVCMGFTACGSDDDGGAESGLNGKWAVTSSEADDHYYEKVGSVWDFSNGKVTIYERDNTKNAGDYRIDPNSLTLYVTITKNYDPDGTLFWEIKNNKLYYYDEDGNVEMEYELSDYASKPDEYKYSINGNVLQLTNHYRETFILTRQ